MLIFLKLGYYPTSNVLDTVFTGEASQELRGIEFGLELLKKRDLKSQ